MLANDLFGFACPKTPSPTSGSVGYMVLKSILWEVKPAFKPKASLRSSPKFKLYEKSP